MAAISLAEERVWFDKPIYDKAECQHFERLAKNPSKTLRSMVSTNQQEMNSNKNLTMLSSKISKEERNKADKKNECIIEKIGKNDGRRVHNSNQESRVPASGSLANEVAKARQHIKKSLQCANNIEAKSDVSKVDITARLTAIENENRELKNAVSELRILLEKLQLQANSASPAPFIAVCPAKPVSEKADDDDDDVDLFGSDSEGEDAEAAKIREERLAAYAAKKSKKPVLIAKSNIIFDVKPWDDETDMKAMEAEVRKITCDGLLWGAAKLVPLAYGIQKLQISCVVEDDKVSIDWLSEEIQKNEDMVQSVDIAAFNKV